MGIVWWKNQVQNQAHNQAHINNNARFLAYRGHE